MTISPPTGVLVVLALAITAATWLAPLPRERTRVTVTLSAATHRTLALWGMAHADAAGRPQTAAQVIERLANNLKNETEIPESLAGTDQH